MQPDVLKNLLRNSSHLRELFLSDVNIGWVLPTYLNISSSLKSLDLSYTGLQGKLHNNIFNLQYLEKLDFSGNNQLIEGELPTSLSKCKYLKILDLGNNQLNGTFPSWLGDLPRLQVLVLKSNGFVGNLPRNLFQNFNARKVMVRAGPKPEYLNIGGVYYSIHLVVKEGKQFNTFEASSFEGNLGLCGFPLPNHCKHESSLQLEGDGDEEESEFTWKVAMLGYECGILIGLVLGYVMFSTGRPKWLNSIADAGEHIIWARQN
ncbi:hypothetical protein L1887_09003 [Cichorium endivia]|nr:hypothetical protein L1887_09003 [Cichorium endivia]